MYNNTPLEERLAMQSRRDPSGCLLWTGSTGTGGYGQINAFGKLTKAHRAAWAAAYGPIPKGMCVCHRCDVRTCIEPTHLFLGTQAENLADMRAKGRREYKRGIACLTGEQITDVVRDSRPSREIAESYGVSHTTINKIKRLHEPAFSRTEQAA